MSWPRIPLKRLAHLRVSNVDKKSTDGEMPVRLCNYTDVYYRDSIQPDQEFMSATASPDQVRTFRLLAGDVLITKDSETADDIGVPAYVANSEPDMICGYHLAMLRPLRQRIDSRFLFWAMVSTAMRDQLAVAATGVTRFGLRAEGIGNALITLPPMDDQRRIADFLDAETIRVDRLVDSRERQRDLALERCRSQIVLALLDPAIDTTNTRLKHLFQFVRNGVWGEDPLGDGTDAVCVRVADFDRLMLTSRQDAKTLRQIDHGQLAPRRLQPGDVLLEKSGGGETSPVGFAVSYQGGATPAVCSNFVAQLRPRARVNGRYAGLLMSAHYFGRKNIAFIKQTTGIQNLDGSAYLSQRVRVPSETEQIRLASRIDRSLEAISRYLSATDRATQTLVQRRHALITTAVTGQLDVTTARGADV